MAKKKAHMNVKLFMIVLGMSIVAYRVKDYGMVGDAFRFLF